MILILFAFICAAEIIEQSSENKTEEITPNPAEQSSENETREVTPTPKVARKRPSGRRGGKPAPKPDAEQSSGQCHGSLCGANDIPDEI